MTTQTTTDSRRSEVMRWLEAHAEHVMRRWNGRVLLRARVRGAAAVPLEQLYAMERGGLVLVVDNEGDASYELWVSSLEDVVLEARPAPEGRLCTGIGYLGVSRTPRILVPRDTEPPPRGTHHGHGEF